MKTLSLLVVLGLVAACPAFATVTLKPDNDGIHVTCDSSMIFFTLGYPVLTGADGKVLKPTTTHVASSTQAVMKFEGGGELDITVDPSGTMVFTGQNLSSVKKVTMRTNWGLEWRNGVTFQAGDAAPVPFPQDKAEKAHMYQGNAPTLTLRDSDGKGVKLTIQKYSYQEVNDQREWGTSSFAYMTSADYADTMTYTFVDAPAAPAAAGASTNAAPANP